MSWNDFKDILRQNREALELQKQLRQSGINELLRQQEEARRMVADASGFNAILRQQEELRRQISDAQPFYPKSFDTDIWSILNKRASKDFIDLFSGSGSFLNQINSALRDAVASPPWVPDYREIKRGIADIAQLYNSQKLTEQIRDIVESTRRNSFASIAQAVAEANGFNMSRLGGTHGSAGLAALDFSEFQEGLDQIRALQESFAGQIAEALKASVEAKESSEETARTLTQLIEAKFNSLPNNRLTAEGLRDTVLQVVAILITLAIFAYQTHDSNRAEVVQTQQLAQLIAVAQQVVENIEQRVPEEDSSVYYVVERQLQLKVKPQTKSPSVALLFPNQRVRLIHMNHQWIYVEYFDYIEGLPKCGWAYKKYLKRA